MVNETFKAAVTTPHNSDMIEYLSRTEIYLEDD